MKHEQIEAPSVGVKGWIEWALVSRDGTIKQAGEQHNLVLDSGLDYLLQGNTAATAHVYVAVGTGSAVPNGAQIALGNEIARTQADLGMGVSYATSEVSPGLYRHTRVRTFDYAQANGNLTEYGASEAGSGTLRTRELFRDGLNNPVVIVKTSAERLVITYHLEVKFLPIVATATTSITITGLGTRNCTHMFTGNNVENREETYFHSTFNGVMFANVALGMTRNSYDGNYGDAGANLPYATGSFFRDVEGQLDPGTADYNVTGIGLGYWDGLSFFRRSYICKFDTPILKDKDYRLKLSIRKSIARTP
jgi:hypothetical protein